MLVHKYALMRRSPFVFLRGSCRMFYEDLAAGRDHALDDAPPVWGCGDLHFENFGSYKGDNRQTYFDLNDFDDGALSRATWELVRFATSVLVAAPELDLTRRDARTQATAFIDAPQRALAAGRARWIERDVATGVVRALLDRERHRKRKQLLRRRTVGEGAARRLKVDGDHMTPAGRDDIGRVRAFVQGLTPPAEAPRFYQVLDVAHRVAAAAKSSTCSTSRRRRRRRWVPSAAWRSPRGTTRPRVSSACRSACRPCRRRCYAPRASVDACTCSASFSRERIACNSPNGAIARACSPV